ncbi:flavoprotein [Promicromonospora sp. AC04]|uniref:flavoprotein n=1 Tax=Promicromonospora sp. AC04 TaxID=2135723 RepID=UPI000D345867|nr:flavoprotein [Promicromonospora sp. AC04]PUB25475.1 flavoprotein [Promicromonospora sp. AC04]
MTGVLFVVVTAAGPTSRVATALLPAAMDRGWDVYCLATQQAVAVYPEAIRAIEETLGRPVRIDFHTTVGYSLPDPDAVIVAPATYNTINKWAAGIADTYVLTRLAEQTGRAIPIAVAPYVNTNFAANPVYRRSLDALQEAGIDVVNGPLEPHAPGGGDAPLDVFPWEPLLDSVAAKRGS